MVHAARRLFNDPKDNDGWDVADFLPGATNAFRQGGQLFRDPVDRRHIYGRPLVTTCSKSRQENADNFDTLRDTMKAVIEAEGVPAFLPENHYGWSFIPFLQGFGGNVFRNPPDDLMPVLDTPEAIAGAEYFSDLLREFGPDGAISYTYDQVVATLKAGRANYSPNGQIFLLQMGAEDSKVNKTCAFSMCPEGPKGRFPGVATHGWGIPVGSKNKDAAWQFIAWAMSKPMIRKMVIERGYSSIARRSLIESPEFQGKLQVNGQDIAKIYLDTIAMGARGYMKYRTSMSIRRSTSRSTSPSRILHHARCRPKRRCSRRSRTRSTN